MSSEAEQRVQEEADYQTALEKARARSDALEGPSIVERLVRLPSSDREKIVGSMSRADLARLNYAWEFWARPKQDPDTEGRRIVFWDQGRGSGKTKSAAERVRRRVYQGAKHIGLIGPNQKDIERYMLGTEGSESGLMQVFHPKHRPTYVSQPKFLVQFHTGATGYVVTAEKPEFRGANLDTVWGDEIAQWRYLQQIWDNIDLATRAVGALPIELILTSTPLPLRFLKRLIADPDCITFLGKTTENATNVDSNWLERMLRKHQGTRLGRQELEGELLGDNQGALFHGSILDVTRVNEAPSGMRVVVAVDPAVSTERRSDETGIIVMGDDDSGHMFVLADLSGKFTPEQWGKRVIDAYDQFNAVAVVVERNKGGDLVRSNVRAAMERKRGGVAAQSIKIQDVDARQGKRTRAEPVSALHERGMIHVVGVLPTFESEITDWDPALRLPSPNRLDAFVWGAFFLGALGDKDAQPKPDYHAGFKGMGAATQKQAESQSPGLSALLGAHSRGHWDDKI